MITLKNRIKNELPDVVTKEQLINYFDANFIRCGTNYSDITVLQLVEIAKQTGKEVKGKSMLDVNLTQEEKLEFIRRTGAVFFRKMLKEKLENNKEHILNAYITRKMSIKKLAKMYGCTSSSIARFLETNNVKVTRGKELKQNA